MFIFLRCVAEAVVEHGLRGLGEMVPGGAFACDVARGAWEKYRQRCKDAREEVQELAGANFEQARVAGGQAADEAARSASPEERKQLALYLSLVPAAVRQSLKRPDDPSGKTAPPQFSLRSPDDVLRLLPAGPLQHQPGNAVPDKPGWVLERPLGVGGFGEVWFARHGRMTSLFGAIKFCRDLSARDRDLLHESGVINRVMAAGKHPNIVPLLDVNLDGATPWLLYEYVEGGDLADQVHAHQGKDKGERLRWALWAFERLADAAGLFHALTPPVVHRDLKPANILFDAAAREVRITDFGIGGVIAKASLEAEVRGTSTRGGRLLSYLRGSHTPLYASPQQKDGHDPDPRDDVHALGVIAYQMLTGRLGQGVGVDCEDDLREAGADEELVRLIRACVAQKAERRPRDGGELLQRLKALSAVSVVPVAAVQTEWEVTVPGEWWRRAGNDTKAVWEAWRTDWEKVCDTPARIRAREGEVYQFRVTENATDEDLAGLAQLAKLSSLQSLDLGCDKVTDAGLSQVAKLSSLLALNLYCEQVTDAGLSQVAKLSSLRSLDLSGCDQVTDAGLAQVAKLSSLQSLDLSFCEQLTDAGLAQVAKLSSLQELHLMHGKQVTDAGLAQVAKLSSLQSLDLGLCKQVTDAGLAQLAKLSSLRFLDVLRCERVTDAGRARLRQALPKCNICG